MRIVLVSALLVACTAATALTAQAGPDSSARLPVQRVTRLSVIAFWQVPASDSVLEADPDLASALDDQQYYWANTRPLLEADASARSTSQAGCSWSRSRGDGGGSRPRRTARRSVSCSWRRGGYLRPCMGTSFPMSFSLPPGRSPGRRRYAASVAAGFVRRTARSCSAFTSGAPTSIRR